MKEKSLRKNKLIKVIILFCGCLSTFILFGCADSKNEKENTGEGESVVFTVESTTEKKETKPEKEVSDLDRFAGKAMKKEIAEINRKTAANEKSMITDLVNFKGITYSELLESINRYTIPEKAYLGKKAFSEEMKAALLEQRNLQMIQDKIAVNPKEKVNLSYGILVKRTDLRSFPTGKALTENRDPKDFDYLQETGVPYASGVIVLHHSSNGKWAYVICENYSGWVAEENIAYCSKKQFKDYLSPEKFLVCIKDIQKDDMHHLGVIVPFTKIEKKKKETAYQLSLPERDANGNLKIAPVEVAGSHVKEYFNEGFLDYSDEKVLLLAKSLLGSPYGWGDTDGLYDCSSFCGMIYRCFGFYMPRNTSILNCFGGNVLDVSQMDPATKLQKIKKHPGAILVIQGHALLYEGKIENIPTVIHCFTSYFESAENAKKGRPIEPGHQVGETPVEGMFFSDGASLLERLQTIVYYQAPDTEMGFNIIKEDK